MVRVVGVEARFPLTVALVGLNVHVVSTGRLPQVKLTLPVNPLIEELMWLC